MLWSCATSMKPPVYPFRLELLSYWWVVALSTYPLLALCGYLPCSDFSLKVFFISFWQACFAFYVNSLAAFVALIFGSFSFGTMWCWNLNFLLSLTTEWSFWCCKTTYNVKIKVQTCSCCFEAHLQIHHSSPVLPFWYIHSIHICFRMVHSI